MRILTEPLWVGIGATLRQAQRPVFLGDRKAQRPVILSDRKTQRPRSSAIAAGTLSSVHHENIRLSESVLGEGAIDGNL